jgi:hypothetical protein
MNTDENRKPEKSPPQQKDRRTMLRVRKQLEDMDDGRLPAPGLGVFVVRTTTKEKDGQSVTRKRITLKLKKPRSSADSTPTAESSSE